MQSLAHLARAFGLNLSPAQSDAFEIYYRELVAWNARMNLTSITERDAAMVKHFLDSLSVAPALGNAATLVDVGSGAGFPGIPLKIALPHLRVTLVDATRKKVEFMQHVIATLGLKDISAVQARAEDLGHDLAQREQYDCAVARALADLAILLEYTLPLVRPGGRVIAQKGVDVVAEVRGAEKAIRVLGGKLRETVPVQLPGLEERHLIVVDKIARTPPQFPRKAGMPAQKPLG